MTRPVENLIFIGTGNFTGTGNSTDNRIEGGALGGLGNDTYFADNARDLVIEEVRQPGGGPVDAFIDVGSSNDMQGGAGNDSLTGGDQGDVMQDQNGGSDTMRGGDGADSMVDSQGVNALFGEGGNDNLNDGSTEATLLDGGNGKDSLFSSGGTDTLIGGAGNDTLEDQSGLDFYLFTGGSGADVFVYRLTFDGGAATTVTDFEDGVDRIGIRFVGESFDHLVIDNVGSDAIVTFTGGFSPMTLVGMAGLISQLDFVDLF